MTDLMTIVAAAVQYHGVTFSLPAPARHADILRLLHSLNADAAINCQQGFLTAEGVFLGRIGAKITVKATGQQTIADTNPFELFTEDLW